MKKPYRMRDPGERKGWDESKHPRAANGKFGEGGGDPEAAGNAQSNRETHRGWLGRDGMMHGGVKDPVLDYDRALVSHREAAALREHLVDQAAEGHKIDQRHLTRYVAFTGGSHAAAGNAIRKEGRELRSAYEDEAADMQAAAERRESRKR